MLAGFYRPGPLLRRERPKPDGSVRRLGVPTVLDRVLQRALQDLLGPELNARLSPRVHGYRPGRSPQTAIRHLIAQTGRRAALEIVHADVSSLFDTLPHDRVWEAVARAWTDSHWLRLNRLWLDAWGDAPGRGIPQGAPLSPLLANLTLTPLDSSLDYALREPGLHAGARLAWARSTLRAAMAKQVSQAPGPAAQDLVAWIRYGDDLVLVGDQRGAGLTLLRWLDAQVRALGLRLSDKKTHFMARRAHAPLPRPVLGERLYFHHSPQGWSLAASITP